MALALALWLFVGQNSVDAGVPARPDACTAARERIRELEQRLEQARVEAEQLFERQGQRCQELLITHGQGAYAHCLAGRTSPSPPNGAQQDLEAAREALRQAQVSGCR